MKRILLIEDDLTLAGLERDFLEINDFEVHHEPDGLKGLERAQTGGYDLILLDLMLPGKDGYEICKAIRAKLDIPILMVTARIEDIDMVRGLGLGADDYIAKPFSPTVLVARVKAHLSRYDRLKAGAGTGSNAPVIDLGYLQINEATRRVYISDREIELTNKEYALLHLLVSNPDMVFSKEHLYERIWGEDALGFSRTIAVHISRLREKIENDPTAPEHIQTVWGVGYRFKV